MRFAPSIILSGLFTAFCSAQDAAKPRQIDFVKDVQPILESNCVSCHNPDKADGGPDGEFDITTYAKVLEGGEHEGALEPGNPKKSRLYADLVRPEDDKRLMPPKRNGGPLKKDHIETIRLWIEQGAAWPKDLVLKQRARDEEKPDSPDNLALTAKLREQILAASKEKSEADMKAYSDVIPKIGKDIKLAPIKGGEFLMGSPETEAERLTDEGPQVKVRVEPFWMGAYEVTWDQYMPFMITPEARWKDGSKKLPKPSDTEIDAISSPTTPYTDMTFGMGQDGFPAISMTEHAANKFCEWLSAQTGHFYRLPTEAEWEYAARAGTSTAYFFGDDPAALGDYGWFQENSDTENTGSGKTQPVGTKKPNPWGLYDIYGNVNEWVLDQYDAEWYQTLAGKDGAALNPFNKPRTLYPHVVRGGGYKSTAGNCRSAKRRHSVEGWKQLDPQLPKSIWYHTNAQFLGFRVVRPLKVPSAEEMHFYWNCGVTSDSK